MKELKTDRVSAEDKAFNVFADMMIEKIESIKDDWQKPWFTEGMIRWPRNLSGREYNGMNALMLMLLSEKNGYTLPYFCTFHQVQTMNGEAKAKDLPKVSVRKGEKSFPVMFTSFTCIHKETKEKIKHDDYKKLSPEEQDNYSVYPRLQVFHVFNVAQTNLSEARPELWAKLEAENTPPKVAIGEDYSFEAVDKMIKDNLWICPIYPKHQDKAYFSPRMNEIVVPEKKQFKDGQSFYGTLFHEMTHSTGREGVLGRIKPAVFGTDDYAREELVAEMGAALVAQRYGMSQHIKEDSCAYLKSWLDKLRESPQFIKTTLSDVKKATAMITQKVDEIALEIEQVKHEELADSQTEKTGKAKQLEISFDETAEDMEVRLNEALLNPQPLRDGVEFANVQRVFEETKAFQFCAPSRITSPRDVAYIFKQLETSSIENAFAVLVKDHKPTVLHLAMGTFDSVMASAAPIIAADQHLQADEIYFVHNHPSGRLKASENDKKVYTMMCGVFGDRVQPGIIINTRSGNFGVFTDKMLEQEALIAGNEPMYNIPTYSFTKQVFNKNYREAGFVHSSADVAAFLSGQRLGDREKLSYIILSPSCEIQANVHTHYSRLTASDYFPLAKRIADDLITYGGNTVVTYGSCVLKQKEVQKLGKLLKAVAPTMAVQWGGVLLDHVNIKVDMQLSDRGYYYESAADEGWLLHEPNGVYNAREPEEEIQGLNLSRQEVIGRVTEYVERVLTDAGIDAGLVGVEVNGSRGRGSAKADSDLDVVIEYHGDMKEYGMFNALNEEPLYIEGVRVDINPIRPEETGTLAQYMERSRAYDTNFGANMAGNRVNNRILADKSSLTDVIKLLYKQGRQAASKIYGQTFFTVARTPAFMKQYGITGEKFTISYGTIARHVGKDSSHNLSEKEWAQLPEVIQTPFAITKLKDRNNAYRLYTELKNTNDEYVVVGVDVKNAGRNIEVNSIATIFGRRQSANLTINEDVVYCGKKITLDQSSLLERPNCAPYPTSQGLLECKDTKNNQYGKVSTSVYSQINLDEVIKKVPVKVNGVKLDQATRRQLALGRSVVVDLPSKKTGKVKPVRLSWSEEHGLTGRPSLAMTKGGQSHGHRM